MNDIVEKLREYTDDDHERLCAGRCYACTCGYDEKRDPLLKEAADTITTLRAEVERLRAALEWYAEYDNYRLLDFSNDMSAVDLDSGTRARAALNTQEQK